MDKKILMFTDGELAVIRDCLDNLRHRAVDAGAGAIYPVEGAREVPVATLMHLADYCQEISNPLTFPQNHPVRKRVQGDIRHVDTVVDMAEVLGEAIAEGLTTDLTNVELKDRVPGWADAFWQLHATDTWGEDGFEYPDAVSSFVLERIGELKRRNDVDVFLSYVAENSEGWDADDPRLAGYRALSEFLGRKEQKE